MVYRYIYCFSAEHEVSLVQLLVNVRVFCNSIFDTSSWSRAH